MTGAPAERVMDHRQAIETLASERYLLDEMTEAERERFEEHYFACSECADDVRAGALMRDSIASGWARQAAPKPATVRWAHWPVLPWALAATLAIAAGYFRLHGPAASGYSGVVGQAVALTPLTLRPASRGTELSATAGPAGILTLAVDLGGRPFDRVSYELRTADGAVIASGQATPPPAGAPLMLAVPATLLHQSAHYVLVVQDPGNADLTKGEYRFRVESL